MAARGKHTAITPINEMNSYAIAALCGGADLTSVSRKDMKEMVLLCLLGLPNII